VCKEAIYTTNETKS